MLYHAKNGNVRIGDTDMDYISFRNGNEIMRQYRRLLISGLILQNREGIKN